MSRRKFDPAIKSLLHFDYPYFNEPGDGLGDEIGLETWSRQNANAYNANVYLCGTVIPYDQKFAPKFGYRCLLSYGGYIQCDNKSGIWNLNSNGQYEIEMFVQIVRETGTRNIFSLMDTEKTTAIFKLSILSGGLLNIVSSGLSIESVSGVTPMQEQIWYHVLVRIFDGCLHLYLDGQIQLTAELLPETKLSVGQVRLGNDVGSIMGNDYVYIDEFLFRHSAGKDVPKVPTEPYNAQLNEANIGGYGTGADGDKMITEYTRLNSFGIIYEINNGTNLTVSLGEEGDCIFSSGSEVMIYVNSTGLYEFRKIISISHTEDGIYITLDKSIDIENGDTFTLNTTLIDTYLVHVISVPNYNTLTINAEATVSPSPYSGIVVFRCKNDCTIDGKILTSGYGIIRNDNIQMTHSQMIDRFMITHGGGIYIVCGGTLRIDENARLGASWSGLGENYNGATGLGGSSIVGNKVSLGGVGGGAGGRGGIWYEKAATITANAIPGGAAGAKGSDGTGLNCCGGGGGCGGKGGNAISGGSSQDNQKNISGSGGGSQSGNGGSAGDILGNSRAQIKGNPSNGCNGGDGKCQIPYEIFFNGAGGGGAGGEGGDCGYSGGGQGGIAGSCIVIVSKKASIPEASISTGGQCGTNQPKTLDSGRAAGAGGTGFCYIAAGELLDE